MLADHDVLGLDVAVDDVFSVGVRDRFAGAREEVEQAAARGARLSPESRVDGGAERPLTGQVCRQGDGGGKTEACLGLAAFVMVLRRLRNPTVQSAGLSALMRYTLRLLTLDQLGRAAPVICALELERQANVPKLGPWPFEIGLWVGQTATPNHMGHKGGLPKRLLRFAFLHVVYARFAQLILLRSRRA